MRERLRTKRSIFGSGNPGMPEFTVTGNKTALNVVAMRSRIESGEEA